MTAAAVAIPPHPARYSPTILDHLGAELAAEAAPLDRPLKVLDPFAGVGMIHVLAETGVIETHGVELEPEWAAAHLDTIVGDATRLPFADGTFDAVATSPAYGNRMADAYAGEGLCRNCKNVDRSICGTCRGTGRQVRHTYRTALGRPLSSGSGAAMQWGDAYRHLHRLAWHEVYRVLRPGGIFLLNVKDHIRKGHEQGVPGWHFGVAVSLGFELDHVEVIRTRGMRNGANGTLRVDGELVASFRKPRRATS